MTTPTQAQIEAILAEFEDELTVQQRRFIADQISRLTAAAQVGEHTQPTQAQIEVAPKDREILLWNGRWNVGSWHDSWTLDQRHPEAEKNGGWIINGGYVVTPTHWAELPAITTAAQVEELQPTPDCFAADIEAATIERCAQIVKALNKTDDPWLNTAENAIRAQVGEQITWDMARELNLAKLAIKTDTIDRCKQVVEDILGPSDPRTPEGYDVLIALEKLKDAP